MAKADVYIDFIIDELQKDNVLYKDVVSVFCAKFRCSDRTFDKYWAMANKKHTEAIRAKELEKQAAMSESLKDEIQAQILTETQIDLILSKIVTGGIQVQEYLKGEKVIRDVNPSDIIAAADKLYKRKGSYAPTKTALTDTDGKDKDQNHGIVLPNGATITIN